MRYKADIYLGRVLFICGILALGTYLFTHAARAQSPELVQQHIQMLYTVVQVESAPSRGSGTVIYSDEREGEVHTYILTNHHVVGNSIRVTEEWDPREKENVKRERRTPVIAHWHKYNDLSRFVGTEGRTADIVAYDAQADLALLRTRDTETKVQLIAKFLPEGELLYMGEKVFAVGSGLGQPPFITTGVLGFMHYQIDGHPYHLSTAPIIFGNSGGALFRETNGEYQIIGVPSMVSIAGFGSVVSHMAWSIQMSTVREFLRLNEFGFILGDKLDK